MPKTLQHRQADFISRVPEEVLREVLCKELAGIKAGDGEAIAEELEKKLPQILKATSGESW